MYTSWANLSFLIHVCFFFFILWPCYKFLISPPLHGQLQLVAQRMRTFIHPKILQIRYPFTAFKNDGSGRTHMDSQYGMGRLWLLNPKPPNLHLASTTAHLKNSLHTWDLCDNLLIKTEYVDFQTFNNKPTNSEA